MRWTRTMIATLRDDPQDAEIVSHKLLVRAGLVKKLSGGLYTFLPLGLRSLKKVERIVREEMDRAGAQEILMPALQPAELWQKSGRFGQMGKSMFTLKDRAEHIMALGPTHEEVVTDVVTNFLTSYKQLPCTVYQVQTKFRDEIRPRFGLMRSKEFIMKDAYSFDTSMDAANASYQAMYDAYTRIFARCGLAAHPVEADTGTIGGNHSHEFMVLAPSGEDGILHCQKCGYSANQERAERQCPPVRNGEKSAEPREKRSTPGAHTIDEAAASLGLPSDQMVKSLVYVADGKPLMVLVRGNDELCECKLRRLLGATSLEMADDETSAKFAGPIGSIGPMGVQIPVYADIGLQGARDVATGANEDGFHMVHVDLTADPDIKIAGWMDLVNVVAGDRCPRCGAELSIERGIEVGHVFKLGTKYTEKFNSVFLDENGKSQVMVMGCYGIGVTRTMQAVIEQSHDDNGIIWPATVAPFEVTILLLDPKDAAVSGVVDRLEHELQELGVDVFVDDREERPGVKFKDADLIGCPVRVVVGAKGLAKGGVEVKLRTGKDSDLVPADSAAAAIAAKVAELKAALNQ
ncbi:MAG: proline--tRNA ligase [Kiritimatiellae bacterium]|nr:proline--tRNA ligase [Kiritimatiellia bacterium]